LKPVSLREAEVVIVGFLTWVSVCGVVGVLREILMVSGHPRNRPQARFHC
jgi:hypothetical protein